VKFLELLPLSSDVVLALTEEGWRLTDGYRFSEVYASAAAAMDDQATRRALTFGEELPAKGGPAA